MALASVEVLIEKVKTDMVAVAQGPMRNPLNVIVTAVPASMEPDVRVSATDGAVDVPLNAPVAVTALLIATPGTADEVMKKPTG